MANTASVLADDRSSSNIFDSTHTTIAGGDVQAAMGRLRRSLRELRSQLPLDDWKLLGGEAREHPLHDVLLESPFTRRAYDKPRGYAGDAVLMDLIYGMKAPHGQLSALGGMLYGYEFDSPCFQSVRARRAILAREIDQVAAATPSARVLAVASGHLREVEWSRAARAGAVEITALDQDRESLECVDRDYGRYRVATRAASIGDLLRRAVDLPRFQLVYAAGLYDYLDQELASTLTEALFRRLAPGGRLLVANFTPATCDAAFMETFMDWQLVYRTADEVRALASGIPASALAALEQFSDENEHVTYMRMVKR